MFDIGASELLLTVIVAIVVIGPKDLPLALRTAGRWIGKVRRVSGHFRTGVETMIREAELEEMEQKWREQNAKIIAETVADTGAETAVDTVADTGAEPASDPAEVAPMQGPLALPEPEPAQSAATAPLPPPP